MTGLSKAKVLAFTLFVAICIVALVGCAGAQQQMTEQPDDDESPDIVYAKSGYIEGYDANDEPVVLQGTEGLSALVGDAVQYFDADHNPIDETELSTRFDKAFFESHDLLCAHCEVGSGAYWVKVSEVERTGDGSYAVSFDIEEPEDGGMVTQDMAYWTALIPIEKQ